MLRWLEYNGLGVTKVGWLEVNVSRVNAQGSAGRRCGNDLRKVPVVLSEMMYVLSLVVPLFCLGLIFESWRPTNSQQVQQVPGLLLWNSSLPANQKLTKGKRNVGCYFMNVGAYIYVYMFIYIYICNGILSKLDTFPYFRSYRSHLSFSPETFEGTFFKRRNHLLVFWVNWHVGFRRSSDILLAAQILGFLSAMFSRVSN